MSVSLKEAKTYLRVDFDEDDDLIKQIITTSTNLCRDIARVEDSKFNDDESTKLAILYAVAYLYEHREEADHTALTLSLRSLLFNQRKAMF